MTTITQLILYNKALRLLGQRALASTSEDVPYRYYLDEAYTDENAILYCLEIGKPVFARKTVKIATSATSAQHDLDNVFTLPADYVSKIAIYSDAKLDQPVNRYIEENRTLACEFDTIYLRYVSSDFVSTLTNWDMSFTNLVAAYLAQQICVKLSPHLKEVADNELAEALKMLLQLNTLNEPQARPKAPTSTLSAAWLAIYNDALHILGLEHLTDNNDDSFARSALDAALTTSLVEDILEDNSWTFGIKSQRLQYDPSLEPEWGYRRVFAKPGDYERIFGVFYDEYMFSPCKRYTEEDENFYADVDELYIQYISSDYLTTVNTWPAYFRKLVAARLAEHTCSVLKGDVNKSLLEYERRKRNAASNDAYVAPPRVIHRGSWLGARFRSVDQYDD